MDYTPLIQKEYFNRTKDFISKGVNNKNIQLLRDIIRYHEWKYYVQNDPVVSDFEYDQLFKALQQLENEFPKLITKDSPTRRVSDDKIKSYETTKHLVPMLSLANSYNADDLLHFDKQIRKLGSLRDDETVEYVVEPKFDGGSVALIYEGDHLVKAATRGNGIEGDTITMNIKTLKSVPLSVSLSKYGIHRVELRGEALIRKDRFKEINADREKRELPVFANPRNAATGGLRTKDPLDTASRRIDVFVYQMGYAVDGSDQDKMNDYRSHSDAVGLLYDLGFKIPKNEMKLCQGIEEVIDYCRLWEEKRDTYDYEIDGMVVKVNSHALQKVSGQTNHHPRWAIAYKFKAKQGTSKLIDIEYQVGKIGSITPVAKVEPIQLAGVTVSSISLHNEDFIQSKDIRLGDVILVERAGDVIPYIVKPMQDLRDGSEKKIRFPKHCPINKKEKVELIKPEGEAAWRCPTCTCGAQDIQRIIFHVSKDAMNIDGLGGSIVDRFFEMDWIKDISDIYNLDYDQISELEGFGEKSAKKLQKSIDKAKSNPLFRLLHSLSIHHLGKKASKLIAKQINHLLDLAQWSEEDFVTIKDIGPVVAHNVRAWFSILSNIEMLKKMEAYGVNFNQTEEDKPIQVAADAPLIGKTILFTGSLQEINRKAAQELAEKMGAKNISAVSSKLDILVVGEKAGSKLKKARTLGTVEIWSEKEFLNKIQQ